MVSRESKQEDEKEIGRIQVNLEELEQRVLGKRADLFAAIGNPIRLITLYELREQQTGMMWKEIQEFTKTSGGSLKFHIDKLEAFNLIENHHRKYRITTKGIGLLLLVDILRDKVKIELQTELEQYRNILKLGKQ